MSLSVADLSAEPIIGTPLGGDDETKTQEGCFKDNENYIFHNLKSI